MARSRDISKVLSSNTAVALDSELALVQIVPTSINVTGGTGSISSNGKISLSAATSIKVNGCFSSSYNNYKISIAGTNTSTSIAGGSFRLVKNGTEASTNYFYTFIYAGNTGGPSRTYGAAQTSWSSNAMGDYFSSVNFDIIEPFVSASRTNYYSNYTAVASNNNEMGISNGFHTTTDSYDGFSWSNGTFTGTILIYGYKS